MRVLEVHRGIDGIRVSVADGDVLTRDRGAVHVEVSRRLADRRGRHIRGGRGPRSRGARPIDVVPEVAGGGGAAHLHRARTGRGHTRVEAGAEADAGRRPLGAGDAQYAGGEGVRARVGDDRIVGEADTRGDGDRAVGNHIARHRERGRRAPGARIWRECDHGEQGRKALGPGAAARFLASIRHWYPPSFGSYIMSRKSVQSSDWLSKITEKT